MQNKINAVNLLLLDARGVYIPRDFVQGFDLEKWHIDTKYLDLLSDPENDDYWDYWYIIENNAYYLDDNGNKYTLYHDGDLWSLCFDLMTDEEKQNFGFELDD